MAGPARRAGRDAGRPALPWLAGIYGLVALALTPWLVRLAYHNPPVYHSLPDAGIRLFLPRSLEGWRVADVPLPAETPLDRQGEGIRAAAWGGLVVLQVRRVPAGTEAGPQALAERVEALRKERRAGYYYRFWEAPTYRVWKAEGSFRHLPGIKTIKDMDLRVELPLVGRRVVRYRFLEAYVVARDDGEAALYHASFAVPLRLYGYFDLDHRWIFAGVKLGAAARQEEGP